MTFVRYGSYQHPANEANLRLFKVVPLYSRRGFRWGYRNIMQIEGEILETTQSGFQTRINGLVEAYADNGNDFGFYDADGNLTNHSITSAASLTGTKVIARDWPKSDGAEWATKRTFRVTVQADFEDIEPLQDIKWWHETVRYSGNTGARKRFVNVDIGAPQKQTIGLRTTQTIIQQGQAIGQTTWPNLPDPILTESDTVIERLDQRHVVHQSPRRERNGFYDYPVQWRYVFESTVSQSLVPNDGG